ncbi:MAG: ribonucleoside-triphosphate reductase, adenosylcobalamin-dependent [Clostridia bacterium]
MNIIKRDGTLECFNGVKIYNAIIRAMNETKIGVDRKLAESLTNGLTKEFEKENIPMTVEDIQEKVELTLMDSERKDVARQYIIYRNARNRVRNSKDTKTKQQSILNDEFISMYKHQSNPFPTQLGEFVYYRTYSRWLPLEQRREYWWETVRRAVEYNCSLVPTSAKEAEKLFDNIYNLKQFLSGRTFWVGGTKVASHYPMANFNCAFETIDDFESFRDLFYLLMVGSGVGVRLLKEDVAKLPKIRTDVNVIHEDYTPVLKDHREDNTSLRFNKNIAYLVIGDSKEGWVQSLEHFFRILYSNEYKCINTIILNYNNVRPKGEVLSTFGGTASGHESLKNMFFKIDKIIKKIGVSKSSSFIKLTPVDCLDFCNIIGENVVVGGVRRTAEIALLDSDDDDCIQAKSNLYKQIDGQWIVDKDIIHRQMSNNSIYYTSKPSRERLHWQIEQMRFSGEPAWINAEAATKRRPNMNGVNPCGEILLDSKGMCNLTTINCFAFVRVNGSLDKDGLLEAQKLSARAGYRMTAVDLELPKWDLVQKRDRLIGCSLTGWQDMVNALNYTKEEEILLLQELRAAAITEAEAYAKELDLEVPLLMTTVKPEGTLSQLPSVSSGVHYAHSPYFIRRVRINSHDPLVKVCEELGYPIYPEVGQNIKNCTTKVLEFPVKAPRGRTKYNAGAIEQLENYKMFMDHYVDHNCSITVHVREHEWEAVEEWIWNHWDEVVAVSFLSLDDSFYELLPYEAIEEEEYNRRVAETRDFVPSLLTKYESKEINLDPGTDGCENGVCPVR